MSLRTDLAATLDAALPDHYIVKARTAAPDQIDTGTLAVRVLPATVRPAERFRSLEFQFTTWVCTGAQDPDTIDDKLDDALDDLLTALLAIPNLSVESAERGVMSGGDGEPRWHGYRLTLNQYATITKE